MGNNAHIDALSTLFLLGQVIGQMLCFSHRGDHDLDGFRGLADLQLRDFCCLLAG